MRTGPMFEWFPVRLALLGVVSALTACAPSMPRSGGPAPVIERGGMRVPPARRVPAPEVRAGVPEAGRSGSATRADMPRGTEIAAYRRPPPLTRTRPLYSSASRSLLSRAEQQQRDGDLDGAVSSIERALRIEPRNAHLWHRLAELRLAQERFRMAIELAEKSNALAAGDRALKRANWLLIADAWRADGAPSKAREAERRAAR